MSNQDESPAHHEGAVPMKDGPLPRRPAALPAWVEATLTTLSGDPLSTHIILGGGIALKHYDDFRPTQDIDAWWRDRPDAKIREGLGAAMERVARERGFDLSHRRWGETDSYEFHGRDSGKKEFSFQISLRDVTLDDPLVSAWPPLWIETLRDNVGSKMNALVDRGAPRDFVDIYRVARDGLVTVEECWGLYRAKNPGVPLEDAQASVLAHLTRLEGRRPLETIADDVERQDARHLRDWFRDPFLQKGLERNMKPQDQAPDAPHEAERVTVEEDIAQDPERDLDDGTSL